MKNLNFFRSQIHQISNGDLRLLFRKIRCLYDALLNFMLAPLAILIIVFIRLFSPFILIRFGQLQSSRIGGLAGITELYLCKRKAGIEQKNTYDLYYSTQSICNQQLLRMLDRVMHIRRFSRLKSLVDFLNCKFPGWEKYHISFEDRNSWDKWGFTISTPPHLYFTPSEEKKGQDELRVTIGCKDSQFVCFHSRDPAYLDNIGLDPTRNYSYHNYRDCSIKTFVAAMEYLTKKGYFAFRMGSKVKEPLDCNNARIIDYATKYRSDFLDIYLLGRCRFFIGCGSGIDEVPKIFRVPIVSVNTIPIVILAMLNSARLFIPKKLFLKKEKRLLAFREILNLDINPFEYGGYINNGIQIIDNTPEEIFAVVKEMEDRLNGVHQTNKKDEELQRRFWSLFDKRTLECGISSRIGAEFLRQNQTLLN